MNKNQSILNSFVHKTTKISQNMSKLIDIVQIQQ